MILIVENSMDSCRKNAQMMLRKKEPGNRRRADALLTARADLLEVREALVAGHGAEALRRTDWLLDRLEEYIAEGAC